MRIKVTKSDIENSKDPIAFASERAFGRQVTVDRKFLLVEGNRFPFRLPLGAEMWNRTWHMKHKGEPFTFEIG